MMGALAGIVGFAATNWQRLAIYGLLAVIVISSAAGWGYHKGVQRLYDYQVKQATEAIKVITLQGKVTQRVITKYIKVQAAAQHAQTTITEEVHRYANPGLCLDPDWRWLHDAAATRTVPPAPGGPDGPGEAPKAATALATVAENYGFANDCADRLDAMQMWVREQALALPQ